MKNLKRILVDTVLYLVGGIIFIGGLYIVIDSHVTPLSVSISSNISAYHDNARSVTCYTYRASISCVRDLS